MKDSVSDGKVQTGLYEWNLYKDASIAYTYQWVVRISFFL